MISALDLRDKMQSDTDTIVGKMLERINSAVLNWASEGRFSETYILLIRSKKSSLMCAYKDLKTQDIRLNTAEVFVHL